MNSLSVIRFNLTPFNCVLYDIGEKIFDLLNNRDLKNSREVCKLWRAVIDNEKYIWWRMIKVHHTDYSMWSEVLMNCNKKTTRELALATKKYYFQFIQGENNLAVEDNTVDTCR